MQNTNYLLVHRETVYLLETIKTYVTLLTEYIVSTDRTRQVARLVPFRFRFMKLVSSSTIWQTTGPCPWSHLSDLAGSAPTR
jgi:hypothetical protein